MRWSKNDTDSKALSSIIAASCKDITPSLPRTPTVSMVVIQKTHTKHEKPKHSSLGGDGVYKLGAKLWILNEAIKLKWMVAVTAHCGEKEHRAYTATTYVVCIEYSWKNIKLDVKEFMRSCIHCIVSRQRAKIPPP